MHSIQGSFTFDLQVRLLFLVISSARYLTCCKSIVIIALHKSHQVLDESRPSGAQLPLPKVQAAAEDSTRLAVELVRLDLVKYCPTIW